MSSTILTVETTNILDWHRSSAVVELCASDPSISIVCGEKEEKIDVA